MASPVKSVSEEKKKATNDTPAELTAVVDDLLDSLSAKFASVSTEIFEKMDAMSKRLDALEAALNTSSSSNVGK